MSEPEEQQKEAPGRQHFSDDGTTRITVEQKRKQKIQVSGTTLVPLHAGQVFQLITHPSNEQIFTHLDRCTHHAVLHAEQDGSRQLVESEHLASWRAMGLSGRLRTRLRVDQDFNSMQSHFSLVRGRFNLLRSFGGSWAVQPQPPERCAHLQHGGGAEGSGGCSLLTLQQELQPSLPLPPPLGGKLRQLACHQVKGIFADLLREAARIQRGEGTLAGHRAAAAGSPLSQGAAA